MYSWCTTPLQSKKTVSKTCTFDRNWRIFFFVLISSECFHWNDWFVTSYNWIWIFVNISWRCFCSKFSNFGIMFAALPFMPKITENLSNIDSKIIQNHFLHCFNVFIGCWRDRAIRINSSKTKSWPSLNRLYHNWTCVLLIADAQNNTVNILNVRAHLIPFLT